MNNLNTILIEGNLVRDPEFKKSPTGTAICKFSIATMRSYKSGEGFEKETSFFDIETWAKLAEACREKGKKARSCRVVGRLKQDRWTDTDGKTRSKVVIVAEHVEFKAEFKKEGIGDTGNSAPADEDIAF